MAQIANYAKERIMSNAHRLGYVNGEFVQENMLTVTQYAGALKELLESDCKSIL